MNATIKKSNFTEWYFNGGEDQENQEVRNSLIEKILKDLLEGKDSKPITIEELWDQTNTSLIPASFFEEYSNDNYDEIGLYIDHYDNIILI